MNPLQVEIGIDQQTLAEAIKDPRRLATELQRIRLPYRFKPNPVAGELEFLSVQYGFFKAHRSRATSLLNALSGEMELLGGDVVLWMQKPNQTHEFRDANRDLWKTMVLAAIFDAAQNRQKQQHVQRYFDGAETIGVALARLIGTKPAHRDNFESFLLNRRGTALDPLSREAVIRLHQDAVLHAERTANNALVGQIYLMCVLGAIGFLELGGLAFCAQFARTVPAWAGEGFGVAAGVEVPLMQAITGVFMGFMGYVEAVGDVMADGEISEDDGTRLWVAFVGIFIPGLFAGVSALLQAKFTPAILRRIGELALLPVSIGMAILAAIDHLLWVISSVQQLIEGLQLVQALAAAQGSDLLLADNEFEIIIPAMPA